MALPPLKKEESEARRQRRIFGGGDALTTENLPQSLFFKEGSAVRKTYQRLNTSNFNKPLVLTGVSKQKHVKNPANTGVWRVSFIIARIYFVHAPRYFVSNVLFEV
jgi:hypothetical protein